MNEKQNWIIFLVILVLGLIAVNKLFGGVSKVVNKVGSSAEKVTDNFGITTPDKANALRQMDAFKPKYWESLTPPTKLLTMAIAKGFAKKVYDAASGQIYSNDLELLGVFKQMKTQSQVSFLSDIFYKEYQKDMLSHFWRPMTNAHLVDLFDHVNGLPKK